MSKECPYKKNLTEEGRCRKTLYFCTFEQESRCEIKKRETRITQADKIRQMNDEELAEFLEKVVSGNRSAIGIACGDEKCENWKCTECIQNWLKSGVF